MAKKNKNNSKVNAASEELKIEEVVSTPTKSDATPNINMGDMKEKATDLLKKVNPVYATLIGFVVLFLLDLLFMQLFTNASIVMSCLVLVIEATLAVCLARCNYGVLGLIALVEIIISVLTKNTLFGVLAVVMYFITLVALHLLRKYGGKDI